MKKLILLILLIPSLLFAGPLQQAHKKVIAGQSVDVGGETYDLFYNCDHPSGSDYAYTDGGNGSPLQATTTGLSVVTGSVDPGVASNDGGSVLKMTGSNDYRRFTTTSSIFTTSSGYVSIDFYIDTLTGDNALWESYGDTSNYFRVQVKANGTINAKHKGAETTVEITTTDTYSDGEWSTVDVRWSTTSGIQARIDGGTWTSGGNVTAFASEPDIFDIGERSGVYTDDTYYDSIKVWNNYEQN